MTGFHLVLIFTLFFLAGGLMGKSPAGSPKADRPRQEIWYHTGYPGGVVGPPGGMSALMGPTKMPAVFEAIVRDRLIEPDCLHTDSPSSHGRAPAAPPIDLASLREAHSDRYLMALFTGEPRSLALSQGLPSWNPRIARGWLLNSGGLAAASETAIRKRLITANLGHGYHHATTDRGMGFCTINGLVVVARKLLRQGLARRVMIVDLDQHEGNGTAEMVIGDPRIWNVSIYGSYMGGPPAASNNHVFHVHHGTFEKETDRDAHYLAVIAEWLPGLIRRHDPDLIIYQAGMDPYDIAGITAKALAIRDAYVFAMARSMNKPIAWVLAGGYADLATLVALHTSTVQMGNKVLARVKPGDRIEHRGENPYQWSPSSEAIIFPDWRALIRGNLRVSSPAIMTEAQAKEWASFRERLLKEERLPDAELESVYRALFP